MKRELIYSDYADKLEGEYKEGYEKNYEILHMQKDAIASYL